MDAIHHLMDKYKINEHPTIIKNDPISNNQFISKKYNLEGSIH